MPLRVLILVANGFIGSSLTRAILTQKDWEVFGMDIGSHKLEDSFGDPRFKFVTDRNWLFRPVHVHFTEARGQRGRKGEEGAFCFHPRVI